MRDVSHHGGVLEVVIQLISIILFHCMVNNYAFTS